MAEQSTLHVYGISNGDRLSLPDYIDNKHLVILPPDGSGERFGEPFTVIAVVAATITAIKGLVAFLAARSLEHKETTTNVTVELVRADGTKETRTITVIDRGEGMSADLAKALGDLTGLKPSDLIG